MNKNFSVFNIFGDHMVLQRDRDIRVSGTAPAVSSVTVEFAGKRAEVSAGRDGSWEAVLPAMPAGGPYEMKITSQAGAFVVFKDVMIGEVWLCSGQSNMEFAIDNGEAWYSLREGAALAAAANDGKLRLFQTQHSLAPDGPCENVAQGSRWQPAVSSDAVKLFSAVGYYFGMQLRDKFKDVAVGMINASWGGSMIEPWISGESFAEAGRDYEAAIAENLKRIPGDAEVEKIAQLRAKISDDLKAWYVKFYASDPEATKAAMADWAKPDHDIASWKKKPLSEQRGSLKEGVTWYRRDFDSDADISQAVIRIGSVNDCDDTFLDGVRIGGLSFDVPDSWCAQRCYPVPSGVLAKGRHVLVVRAINHFGTGGICGAVTVDSEADSETKINLAEGIWAAKTEYFADIDKIGSRPALPADIGGSRCSMQSPTILYNSLIHPFTKMNLRGILWYQGCSNAGNERNYSVFQPLLIDCWRKAWGDMSMPFLVTQLSAFEGGSSSGRLPDDFWKSKEADDCGTYPYIREVQDKVHEIPGAGVAVTIDIGDSSDIHPANKKDVAARLFALASKLCYGCGEMCEGPRFASVKKENGALRVSFSNADGGLVAKGGSVGEHSFAVAGKDGQYVWADAEIDGSDVIVRSGAVPDPVDVRYAWMMYPPNPNLYNKAGFPMYPFRTDKYK